MIFSQSDHRGAYLIAETAARFVAKSKTNF